MIIHSTSGKLKDIVDYSQYLPSMKSTGLRVTNLFEHPQKFHLFYYNCKKWLFSEDITFLGKGS